MFRDTPPRANGHASNGQFRKGIVCCYRHHLYDYVVPLVVPPTWTCPEPIYHPCNQKQTTQRYCSKNDGCSYTDSAYSTITLNFTSPGPNLDGGALDESLLEEAPQVIRAMKISMHGIAQSYFSEIHSWAPFISPDIIYSSLPEDQAQLTPDISLLLLCMCLLTYNWPQDDYPQYQQPWTQSILFFFFFFTERLFMEIKSLKSVSLHTIQAGILLSLFESSQTRPNNSLSALAICARLAAKAGIFNSRSSIQGQVQIEGRHTWIAMFIFERIFYCEAGTDELQLFTPVPPEAEG